MEISRNLSKQPFSTSSGRIKLKNSLRDYFYLLKSPDFRLLVLKCSDFLIEGFHCTVGALVSHSLFNFCSFMIFVTKE